MGGGLLVLPTRHPSFGAPLLQRIVMRLLCQYGAAVGEMLPQAVQLFIVQKYQYIVPGIRYQSPGLRFPRTGTYDMNRNS